MFLPETKRITISALTPEQEAIIAEQRQEINFQIAELKNTNLNVLGSQLNDALENALEVLRDYEARLRSQSETVIAYRNGDNVRILIEEKTLLGGSALPSNMSLLTPEQRQAAEDKARSGGTIYKSVTYEFYTVDGTLDDFDLSSPNIYSNTNVEAIRYHRLHC